MRVALALTLAPTLTLALVAPPALAATGEELFNAQCGDCHTLGDASTDQGPSLKGVVGRPVAAAKDFPYSDALKARGGVWTESGLDAFLANPNTTVPGTAMFGGAPVASDRAAIIAYLKTVK